MLKALVVLLYLIGIGVILGVTALLARRSAGRPVPDTAPLNGHHPAETAVATRSARSSIIGMLLILAAGAAVVFALVCLLGLLVVHAAPGIDKTIYTWMIHHRMHAWKSVMERATKVGDTWTTWGATVAAAVCLAALYRRDKWLPGNAGRGYRHRSLRDASAAAHLPPRRSPGQPARHLPVGGL